MQEQTTRLTKKIPLSFSIESEEIDVSNITLTSEDKMQLTQCVTLRSLNVEQTGISDLNFLRNFSRLEALNISGNPISDLSPIRDLLHLKKLVAHDTDVSDLTPLENLTQISVLEIERAQISDVSALKKLKSLKVVDFYGNANLFNIEPLSKLTNLQDLTIKNTGITEAYQLNCLRKLTSLTQLSVNHDLEYLVGNIVNKIRQQPVSFFHKGETRTSHRLSQTDFEIGQHIKSIAKTSDFQAELTKFLISQNIQCSADWSLDKVLYHAYLGIKDMLLQKSEEAAKKHTAQ